MGPDLSTAPVRVAVEPTGPTQDFTSGDTLVLEVTLYDALNQTIRPSVSKDVASVRMSASDGKGSQLNLLGSPIRPGSEPSLVTLPNLLQAPGSSQTLTFTATMFRSGAVLGTNMVRVGLIPESRGVHGAQTCFTSCTSSHRFKPSTLACCRLSYGLGPAACMSLQCRMAADANGACWFHLGIA